MTDTEENPPVVEEPVTAKDPKKVEQGKRLAAISKEAKERKMRARIREEDFSYAPWIGYGVATLSSLGLIYLLLFSSPKKSEPELEKTTYVKSPSPIKTKKKRFEDF